MIDALDAVEVVLDLGALADQPAERLLHRDDVPRARCRATTGS